MAPHARWGAWGLLMAGLIFTALASLYIKAEVEAAAQREVDFTCNEIRLNIADRLASSAQILHSSAALFDASDTVTRAEWRAFTRGLQVDRQLPGIQGIGFARLIPREQLAQHVQAIRREGFPDYRIWPAGEREAYSAIVYLEPFSGRNLRAFGYDMLSETVRRAAMERARDEDVAALSGKVVLVQETAQEVQAGALMYVPVYRHGLPRETIEQRRAAIQGWVYSPYRMSDLMHGTLRGWDVKQKDREISLQVYDGDVVSASTLLYDSHRTGDNALTSPGQITRLIPIEAAGHRWTLRFLQLGDPASAVGYGSVWLVLLGGTIINLLCFGLALSWLNTRANARRTRTLVESLPQLVWTSLPDGRCDYLSPQWVAYTGLPPQGQLGYGWTEQVHPADRPRAQHDWQEAVATGRDFVLEFRIRRADGAYRWFHTRAVPLRDAAGRIVKWFGTNMDVEDRKQAEVALRASEAAMREAQAIARMGHWDLDLTGEHLDWSDGIFDLFEVSRETFAATYEAFLGFLHPDDRAIVDRTFRASVESGEPYEIEHRLMMKDGRIKWVNEIGRTEYDNTGSPIRSRGTVQDITARKRVEEALNEAQAILKVAMDCSQAGIAIADAPSGILRYVNRAGLLIRDASEAEALTGIDINQYVARWNLLDLDGTTLVTDEVPLVRALTRGEECSREFIIRRADSEDRIVWANAAPILSSTGEIKAAIVVFVDITERRLMEETLKRTAEELNQTNEEVRQFAYIVSHDLRAPLVNVRGFTSELSRSLADLNLLVQPALHHLGETERAGADLILRRDVPDAVGFIDASVIRMDHLINALLRLSRLGRHELILERINLESLVSWILASLGTQIEARGATVTVLPLPEVTADRTSLEQILGNILTNAVLYLDPARPGRIEVSGRLAGTDLLMKISDNGRGIAPEDREKVFAPFRRAGAHDVPGEGMGMAYVQALIRHQGGRIWLDSEPGVGTTFSFVLPVLAPEGDSMPDINQPRPAPPLRQGSDGQIGQALRRHAEEIAWGDAAPSAPAEPRFDVPAAVDIPGSREEIRRILHELRVHQIELEMQNEELRRAYVELDAAGARHFAFYDLSPVGYCTLNEDGLILEANLTAATLLGMARSALEKQPITRFILPEDQDTYYWHRKRLLETDASQASELRMVKSDGTSFWARLATVAAQDEGGAPASRIVLEDITARKQAEEALREAEATVLKKFDAIMESSEPEGDIGTLTLADIIDPGALQAMMDDFYAITHIGIGILDVQGNTLVATGWQDICTKFHRVHPETLKNCQESDCSLADGVAKGTFKAYRCKNNLWDVVTPIVLGGRHLGNVFFGQYFYEDEVPDYDLFRSQARRYGFDETEYLAALDRVHRCSREKVDAIMAFYAKFAEMISSLSYSKIKLSRALSQSDEAFRQLHASEDLFRKAFLASPDSIAITRLTDGMFVSVNHGFEQITGYTREQALGKTSLEINVWKDPEDRRKVVEELRAKGEVRDYGAPFLTRHGEIYGLMSATIIELSGVPHILNITRDITARKQAEEALQRTAEALSQSNEEVRQFAYIVSHDLRAPLVNFRGFASELRRSLADLDRLVQPAIKQLTDDERAGTDRILRQDVPEALGFIDSSVIRMDNLINALLRLSRLGRHKAILERVDLGSLVSEVLASLGRQVEASGAMVTILPLPEVIADRTSLEQILSNILTNAVLYLDPARPGRIEVSGELTGTELFVKVRDNGRGIAPGEREKVFAPFRRIGAPEVPGEGMGLAYVQALVRRQGGRIWFDSEPGVGTTFSFVLPVTRS